MARRAENSGITLSVGDVAIIKGMLARGDRQHDIAAWFGVNGGRITEIRKGYRYFEVEAAPASALPPPGPYPKVRQTAVIVRALNAAKAALAAAEELIQRGDPWIAR